MSAQEQRVNCRWFKVSGGGHQLVFTIDGTNRQVGEVRVMPGTDPQYLRCIGKMFGTWAEGQTGGPADLIRPVDASVLAAIGGRR